MDKDLLNEPYDADIAAAVERLRQAWLKDKRRRAEIKHQQKTQQAQQSTPVLKGFEDAFEQAMNQTLA